MRLRSVVGCWRILLISRDNCARRRFPDWLRCEPLYVPWPDDKLTDDSTTAQRTSGLAIDGVTHGGSVPNEKANFFLCFEPEIVAAFEQLISLTFAVRTCFYPDLAVRVQLHE